MVFKCLDGRGRMKFWLMLLAFTVVYLAFRLPWMSCDPGIASVWEYGYNATDEGYYLSGGKEKFVWGFFVDMPRNEAFTYGYSAGTHWMSYLAHRLFGLSTWTWRIPFFVLYFCGWIAMFCHVSRRAGAYVAFALCTAISVVPMVVAYERTASNDALIAALVVLSYVCAAGGTRWRIAVAGVLAGAIVLVKPSVYVLLPIIAAGVADERDIKTCFKDIALFAVVAVASVFAWKLVVALSVIPDAKRAGISVWEVIRKTTTHYPLPSIFEFASHFKGLSAFPRDPSLQLLGGLAALVFPVPLGMAVRSALAGRFNGRLILFLAVPAYIAAVSVMNTIYTHYFLPVVVMLPILLLAASREMTEGGGETRGRSLHILFAVVALCAVGILFLASYSLPPAVSQTFYSRIYNLPAKNVWGMTWPQMSIFVAVAAAAVAVTEALRGTKAGIVALRSAAAAVVAFFAASVVFAALPGVTMAPYMRKASADYLAPMSVSFVASAVLLAVVFGLVRGITGRVVVLLALPLCVVSSYLATPNWRSAFCELVRHGTHLNEQAAKELAALLPKDAIVIGERSNQMLMSLPVRTATTFASNSDPIPVIESILKAEPGAKLYALADSQHAYNLQHYKEHADKYQLRLVKTFKMPSFGTGALADVYLCEISNVSKTN